jgi:hypothetical protein
MGRAARRSFLERFTLERFRDQLAAFYHRAAAG